MKTFLVKKTSSVKKNNSETKEMHIFGHLIGLNNLQTDLGSSPVSSLGVVLDGVTSTVSDPVWDWSILFLLFSQNELFSEFFVSRHFSVRQSKSDSKMG